MIGGMGKEGNGKVLELVVMVACMHAKSLQSCPTLCDPMDCSPPAPLSMGFSRQEYWSRLPCSPPGLHNIVNILKTAELYTLMNFMLGEAYLRFLNAI